MSQYATRPNLEALGLPADAFSGMDDTAVDLLLSTQSAIADGYIAASGKKLPLESWGDDLRMAVAKMAAYEILCIIGHNPEVQSNLVWRERQQDAIGWLKDLAAGRASNVLMIESAPVDTLADRIEIYSEAQRGW